MENLKLIAIEELNDEYVALVFNKSGINSYVRCPISKLDYLDLEVGERYDITVTIKEAVKK
ncbi:MAG TPA: hypothetical protein ENL23_01640 [Candidatus Acetothermia bacterium]|nr:hypothetical protein [Candidatus Acetothermia bacterium]